MNKTLKQAAIHLPWLIKDLKMATSTHIGITRCISMALEWKNVSVVRGLSITYGRI